jgi:hypothetical protein
VVISAPARRMLVDSDRVRSGWGCDVKLVLALSTVVRISALCLLIGFGAGVWMCVGMPK